MSLETVTPTTETPVPAGVETPSPEPAETKVTESPSITAHAEAFGRARDEQGRFAKEPETKPERHRASSQKATADDVAQINDLTKQLRQKEQELLKIKPDAGTGSARILNLRRQIRGLEAELAEVAPKSETPKAAEPAPTPKAEPLKPPAPFQVKPPDPKAFETADDPYAEQLKAQIRYEQQKEAHEAEQRRFEEQRQARDRQVAEAHHARMAAFAAKTPDFQQVTAGFIQRDLPPSLLWAIVQDDNGPQHVYTLAKDPEFAEELIFAAEGKPVSDATVGYIRRRLNQRVTQAVTTGSAAPTLPKAVTPPRPPNPVRTGPTRTTDDPPGEAVSIAEHAQYHGRRLRK